MDRATFLQKITVFSGLFLSATKNRTDQKRWIKKSKTFRPNEAGNWHRPTILDAPWGQKVFYDHHTYTDYQKALRMIAGDSEQQIEDYLTHLKRKFDNGILSLRKGPAKLLEGLWLIDVDGQQNIYLLQSKDGLILIDPSMDATTPDVISQIKSLGFSQWDVTDILLTHCHVDHAQSAAYWQKNGAEVWIHELDKNPIQTGNEITAWWIMGTKKDRYFPKVKKVNAFCDGDTLHFGEHEIFICHTPGHTPGSTCFYLKKDDKNILISGDTLFHNGKHGWMGNPYVDYEMYLNSLWKLKNFSVKGHVHNEKGRLMVRRPVEFDMLLPGHTAISYDMVSRDIMKGIEIMSYTLQQRRSGVDYQWTEPYTFFAERQINNLGSIDVEYR